MKRKNKAFTLVELIIVITILAILATIAFISFQGYTKNARDSNRTSTLANLQKGLDIYLVQVGTLPEPEGTILSGTLNGVQLNRLGIIGDNISRLVKSNKIPTDPVSGNNYVYGISSDNKYYQIGVTLENLESYNLITKTTYADNGSFKSKVVGNYKYPLKLGNKLYSLPGLLFTGTGGDLTQTGNAYFIVDKGLNIPYTPDKSALNNTQTTTLVLQSITGTGGLSLTGITLPTETSEQFKTLTNTSTTLQNLQQALGITNQTQLGNVIYGNSYSSNTSINSGGGSSSSNFLANCTNTSSLSGIIYTDSNLVEVARVSNTGTTISGNPSSLTCAGNIIVCAGSGTGYILDACNVGATTVYTNQTFTNGATGVRDATINSWAGGLYQWGRDEEISTGTYITDTYVGTLTSSKVGNNNFYKGDATYGEWWQTEIGSGTNTTRWTGTSVQSLCDIGYHIPTGGASGEWQAIYNAGGWGSVSSNKGTALSNSLRLPFAGNRNWNNGNMISQSSYMVYWSSSPTATNAYSFVSDTVSPSPASSYDRAYGFSLRCIKN